jgi:hypothetical protein
MREQDGEHERLENTAENKMGASISTILVGRPRDERLAQR